jgi:hypothetical protein
MGAGYIIEDVAPPTMAVTISAAAASTDLTGAFGYCNVADTWSFGGYRYLQMTVNASLLFPTGQPPIQPPNIYLGTMPFAFYDPDYPGLYTGSGVYATGNPSSINYKPAVGIDSIDIISIENGLLPSDDSGWGIQWYYVPYDWSIGGDQVVTIDLLANLYSVSDGSIGANSFAHNPVAPVSELPLSSDEITVYHKYGSFFAFIDSPSCQFTLSRFSFVEKEGLKIFSTDYPNGFNWGYPHQVDSVSNCYAIDYSGVGGQYYGIGIIILRDNLIIAEFTVEEYPYINETTPQMVCDGMNIIGNGLSWSVGQPGDDSGDYWPSSISVTGAVSVDSSQTFGAMLFDSVNGAYTGEVELWSSQYVMPYFGAPKSSWTYSPKVLLSPPFGSSNVIKASNGWIPVTSEWPSDAAVWPETAALVKNPIAVLPDGRYGIISDYLGYTCISMSAQRSLAPARSRGGAWDAVTTRGGMLGAYGLNTSGGTPLFLQRQGKIRSLGVQGTDPVLQLDPQGASAWIAYRQSSSYASGAVGEIYLSRSDDQLCSLSSTILVSNQATNGQPFGYYRDHTRAVHYFVIASTDGLSLTLLKFDDNGNPVSFAAQPAPGSSAPSGIAAALSAMGVTTTSNRNPFAGMFGVSLCQKIYKALNNALSVMGVTTSANKNQYTGLFGVSLHLRGDTGGALGDGRHNVREPKSVLGHVRRIAIGDRRRAEDDHPGRSWRDGIRNRPVRRRNPVYRDAL